MTSGTVFLPEMDWEDLRWVDARRETDSHVRRATEVEGTLVVPTPTLTIRVASTYDRSRVLARALEEHGQDPGRWYFGAMTPPSMWWPFPFLRVYLNGPGKIERSSGAPKWAVAVREARWTRMYDATDHNPTRTSERLGRALANFPKADLDAFREVYDLGGVNAVVDVLRAKGLTP